MESLEHITITTGATRQSPRSEVGDHAVAEIRAALARDGKLWSDWSVKLLPAPPGSSGAHVFDLFHRRRHIARCWLCENAATSKGIWEAAASSGFDPNVRLTKPRTTPWLAVALTVPGISVGMTEPSVLIECGDLERCVAWAILE